MTTPEDPGTPDPSQSPYGSPPPGPPGMNPPPQYGAPPPGYGQAPPGYPQPQPGQPAYGQPQWAGQPMQAQGTNGMAIAALVLAILPLCPLLGLILGFVAKSQIKSRGGGGGGLATAAIVISLLWIALTILGVATGVVDVHTSGSSGS